MKNLTTFISKYYVHLIFSLTLFGAVVSLYYSEIEKELPCTLCWWQRIFIFGILIVSTVALFFNQKKVYLYFLPFSLIGILFSTYHILLQETSWIEESEACSATISCEEVSIEWFGFFTMPMAAFLTFAFVIVVSLIVWKKESK